MRAIKSRADIEENKPRKTDDGVPENRGACEKAMTTRNGVEEKKEGPIRKCWSR